MDTGTAIVLAALILGIARLFESWLWARHEMSLEILYHHELKEEVQAELFNQEEEAPVPVRIRSTRPATPAG